MALNIEVAELMKQPGRVYEVAEKTQYNRAMDAEDKEIAEVVGAHVEELIDKGDPNKEIAQFVNRTVTDELYGAPDELLDSMFERGNVGEFDDYEAGRTVKNTLKAYDQLRVATCRSLTCTTRPLSPSGVISRLRLILALWK